ncbi:hypothetical protein CL629_02645 [bacterium]|nr:hypothetical protein [bacterium]
MGVMENLWNTGRFSGKPESSGGSQEKEGPRAKGPPRAVETGPDKPLGRKEQLKELAMVPGEVRAGELALDSDGKLFLLTTTENGETFLNDKEVELENGSSDKPVFIRKSHDGGGGCYCPGV